MSEAEIGSSDIYLCESVKLQKGEKYLIKAASGHGKSSLLNFIYGANQNFEGKIQFSKTHKSIVERRRYCLSYVFQDFKLFPALSIFENILLKNKLTEHKTVEQIDEMLELLQLGSKKNRLVQQLSLGERQRVAIIRALCMNFDFLLLDEPFSHLDENNIKVATQLIKSEIENNEAGLILTSLGSEYYFEYDKVLML